MFFKEKIPLGSFVRDVAGLTAGREFDVAALDAGGELSEVERSIAMTAARPFHLVVLHMLLSDMLEAGKLSIGYEELGELFVTATCLGYQDAGFSDDDTLKLGETYSSELGWYTEYLGTVDQAELLKRGFYFWLCQGFVNKYLPSFESSGTSTIDKHFILFELAKQIYRNSEEGLKHVLKRVKLVT